ncbi:MAG TPA: glycosyl hydrolase [Acidimicrobiales bacterium]|nr:glycosyl hydrolase [Acidimicrobiales bacterium]
MRKRMTFIASFVVALLLVVVASSAQAGASGASSIPLGDYAGADSPTAVAQFGADTGTNPVLATDFLDGSSWGAIDSASGIGAWNGSGYQLVLAVPILPRHGRASLRRGARGAYNRYFVTLARNLVDNGEGNAFLRLGWEFNGNWYKWSVRNARGALEFAAYFRTIVDAMRSVPGEAFKFVWNPNAGSNHGQPYNPADAYPGNAYVDYIGTDLYDESWVSSYPATAWTGQLEATWGLHWLAGFAAEHGKPIVFPEWGVAIRSDGHGLGDDPYFVNAFASWITTHDVAWTNIFSFDGDQQDDITDGSFNNALAAFRADFG